MSFLQLPPASRRLRQAAKAHAAGEMARADYRRMRRDIIDELNVEFAANGAVVDSFSIGSDSTQRRRKPLAVTNSLVVEPSAPGRTLMSNIFTAVAVFLVVLALFVGGAAFATPVLSIPPLNERDPNPQNSMVLSVSGVRVSTITPAPDLSEAAIADQVDRWFSAALATARDVGSSGFSESEIGEVANLLNRLGVHDSDGLDANALSALNTLVARQKRRRLVSLEQLERIAEKLQDYFRSNGYLAARAYVPAQTIVNNEVALHVLPGRLESVVTESTTGLAALATQAFATQIGAPAQAESLEQILYKLNSLSGVQATGSLQAGDDVGGTRLNLQLSNPSRLVGGLFFDNHSDKRSAKYRLRGLLDWQNPLGRGDSLRFEVAQRFESQEATGVALNYRTPTFKLGDVATLSYALNDFSVSSRTGDFDGQSSTLRFGGERQLFGQRERSLTLGVRAARQRLELAGVDQKLWWVEPEVAAHQVFDESRWVLRGRASVAAGKLGAERYLGQSASFALVRAELSAWRPVATQELHLRFSGQLGTEDLPDSLKQTLGGYGQITAVRPGSFLADSALVMGLEMTATPARLREFGTLAFYTRVGSGQRELANDVASAFAWEGGVVWRLAPWASFTGEIRLGFPLSVDGLNESGDEDARLLLSLGWRP